MGNGENDADVMRRERATDSGRTDAAAAASAPEPAVRSRRGGVRQKRRLVIASGFVAISMLGALVACNRAPAFTGRPAVPGQEEAAAVQVVVEPYPGGNIARPGDVHVSKGGAIRWQNNTGDRVVISIPDERVFGSRITEEIPDGKVWRSPPVVVEKGIFEYGIYCYNRNEHAIGGHSGPKIIVP